MDETVWRIDVPRCAEGEGAATGKPVTYTEALFVDWHRVTAEEILRRYLPDEPLLPYDGQALGRVVVRWRRVHERDWRPDFGLRKARRYADLEPILSKGYGRYCLHGWFTAPPGSELHRRVAHWCLVDLDALRDAWPTLEPIADIVNPVDSPFGYYSLSIEQVREAGCLICQMGDPAPGATAPEQYEQVEFLFEPT